MTRKLLHDERLKLSGNRIHVLSEAPDDFEVWLNTDVGDFDGLCIGCGSARQRAVLDTISILEKGALALRNSGAATNETGG